MEVLHEGTKIPRGSMGVWTLAWPSIITNLFYATSSIVAIKIVGNLGPDAIAAAVTGQRVTFILQAVLTGVLAGSTALIARNWGANDRLEAGVFFTRTVQLVLLLSLILSLLVWQFAEPLVKFFGLKDQALALSILYLKAISPFYIAFGCGMALITALRAVGDVKTPLIIGFIMNVFAIFFMLVFVNGWLGFPKYGVVGAAFGNGVSFVIGASLLIVFWLSNQFPVRYFSIFTLDTDRVKQIFQVGLPAALEQIIFQIGITAFLILVAYYGTEAYAAYGIGVQILSFSFVIGFGFSIAGATLVGQHLGAKNTDQAKRAGWGAMRLSIISMTFFGIIITLFAEPLARFMIDNDEVVRLTVIFIWLLGSMQPLMAIEFSLGGALRGAGDTKTPLAITLTCLLFIRVFLAVIFFLLDARIEVIFSTLVADYVVKGFLYVARFKSDKWMNALKSKEAL
ncbi:MATE family efflux transporter [Gammaproteobacteria bacterium]|nr:MATE family efflux transporter [Gammaproteobacteria bacterium]MDB2339299.1 MATE family efflux transporter [Gammaproteobacteria bacterium]MDC0906417.1 MATE family efflux transporter [Gammaproteobacteria bacterium]MDC1042465.1 MATE family efflux transporter [Gammaproteobacteria bacterium]